MRNYVCMCLCVCALVCIYMYTYRCTHTYIPGCLIYSMDWSLQTYPRLVSDLDIRSNFNLAPLFFWNVSIIFNSFINYLFSTNKTFSGFFPFSIYFYWNNFHWDLFSHSTFRTKIFNLFFKIHWTWCTVVSNPILWSQILQM